MYKELKCYDIQKERYIIDEYGNIYDNINCKYIKFHYDKDGYKKVSLKLNSGKRYTFMVHRLVCKTFKLVQHKDKKVVNHKDSIKTNNHISNLEWCTVSHNTKHAYDMGLITKLIGEKSSSNVYSEKLVIKICKYIAKGLDNDEIINKLYTDNYNKNSFKNLVRDIRRKKSWTYLSNKYF